jgi:hypothetical protein
MGSSFLRVLMLWLVVESVRVPEPGPRSVVSRAVKSALSMIPVEGQLARMPPVARVEQTYREKVLLVPSSASPGLDAWSFEGLVERLALVLYELLAVGL